MAAKSVRIVEAQTYNLTWATLPFRRARMRIFRDLIDPRTDRVPWTITTMTALEYDEFVCSTSQYGENIRCACAGNIWGNVLGNPNHPRNGAA